MLRCGRVGSCAKSGAQSGERLIFDRPFYVQLISEQRRRTVAMIVIGVLIALCASLLLGLRKDTTVEAFVPDDHPAVVYRDIVAERFGLRAPLLIAIVAPEGQSVFTPEALGVVDSLTDSLRTVPNIDSARITSLSTVTYIAADGPDLIIEPVMDAPPMSQEAAASVEAAARLMPSYAGALYSEDGRATLIAAEVIDQQEAAATAQALETLAANAAAPEGFELHVAGEAAASAYLTSYLDRDTLKLLPIGTVVMVILTYFAFRTVPGTLIPSVVVAGSLAGAVGLMAGFGVPYFVISNALPAILIGIAVADAVHIISHYYEDRFDEDRTSTQRALGAVQAMWRPITLTTLTTIFGFLGIAMTSSTPPMMWFGVFAIVGILCAYVVSLIFVPAALATFAKKPSSAFSVDDPASRPISRFVTAIVTTAVKKPGTVLLIAALTVSLGLIGASRVRVDSAIQDPFKPTEPIVIADNTVNAHFHGSNYLDIVIETGTAEGMTEPERLAEVEALEEYLVSLPHVNGVVSIIDPLKRLNQSLNFGEEEFYTLPNNATAVAQQLFLLTASSRPDEWATRINTAQDSVLVRALVDTSRYSEMKDAIEATEAYIARHFSSPGMSANVSGALAVNYHILGSLAAEHLWSVAIAVGLVFAAASILFRSLLRGTLTVVPVMMAIVLVYGVMGLFGVHLNVATSMFAAIAVGLGVDFTIHMIERIDYFRMVKGLSLDDAVAQVAPLSGRALFINFAIVFFGFGVVGLSELSIMRQFGGLVAAAVFGSFFASLTVVPAILKLADSSSVFGTQVFKGKKHAT